MNFVEPQPVIVVAIADTETNVSDRKETAVFQTYVNICCGGFPDVAFVFLPYPLTLWFVDFAGRTADTEAVGRDKSSGTSAHLAKVRRRLRGVIDDVGHALHICLGDRTDHGVGEDRQSARALLDLSDIDLPVRDVLDFDEGFAD